MKLVMCAGHGQRPLINSMTLVLRSSNPQPSAFPTPCPLHPLSTPPCTTSSIRKASHSHGRGPGCPAECRLRTESLRGGAGRGGPGLGWSEGREASKGDFISS